MENLKDLYQQVILDHYKNPKNFKIIPNANREMEGYNPLCGDKVHLYLVVEDGVIKDVGFQGTGCAISKAAASLMTTVVKGKTVEEAEKIFENYQKLITGKVDDEERIRQIGKLAVFAGVREYPTRVKCAALPWHTLIAALKNQKGTVTTEEETGQGKDSEGNHSAPEK